MAMSLVALSLARLAYGLLLPYMRADLTLSFQQAGNLGTATSLGYLLLVLPAGYLTRQLRPRPVILFGLLQLFVGFLGLALSVDYLWLLFWMIVLGTGTALVYTPVVSFIVGWFPERRGLVLGLVNSGIGLGVFGCGLIIPFIASAFGVDGWRRVWGLFALISAVVAVLGILFIRNPPGDSSRSSTQLSSVSSVAVYYSPVVRVLGLCYFITGFSYIVQTVFMYSYALSAGVSEDAAGAMASLAGILSIFSSLMWGVLSDYTGRPVALFLCFSGAAVATVIPVLLSTDTGFLIHYILSGFTVSGLFATIVAATSERIAPAEVPIAIGFVTTLFAVGQLAGPTVAGWLIDLTGTFRFAFILSGSTMVAGALFALVLYRMYKRI